MFFCCCRSSTSKREKKPTRGSHLKAKELPLPRAGGTTTTFHWLHATRAHARATRPLKVMPPLPNATPVINHSQIGRVRYFFDTKKRKKEQKNAVISWQKTCFFTLSRSSVAAITTALHRRATTPPSLPQRIPRLPQATPATKTSQIRHFRIRDQRPLLLHRHTQQTPASQTH